MRSIALIVVALLWDLGLPFSSAELTAELNSSASNSIISAIVQSNTSMLQALDIIKAAIAETSSFTPNKTVAPDSYVKEISTDTLDSVNQSETQQPLLFSNSSNATEAPHSTQSDNHNVFASNQTTSINSLSNISPLRMTEEQLTKQHENTYQNILKCLKDTKEVSDATKNFEQWKFPIDAHTHYAHLLKITEKYRNLQMHAYHYKGPWIENRFISTFIDKPLEYFGGFIPLFVQFVDVHVYTISHNPKDKPRWNASMPVYTDMIEDIIKELRHDVLYLAVSQDDQGILNRIHQARPNILIISGGGNGHVPMPLVKGELEFHPPRAFNEFKIDAGFFGNLRPNLSRYKMMMDLKKALGNVKVGYKAVQSPDWLKQMEATKFNLAPRGFGRTSFRLAEVIQTGRVPVYIWDDTPWLPYEGTEMALSTFGYVGKMGEHNKLAREIQQTTPEQYKQKIEQVARVRHLYTYEGVLEQIFLFMQDPQGPSGGFLRCRRFPSKDHRRLEQGAQTSLRGSMNGAVRNVTFGYAEVVARAALRTGPAVWEDDY